MYFEDYSGAPPVYHVSIVLLIYTVSQTHTIFSSGYDMPDFPHGSTLYYSWSCLIISCHESTMHVWQPYSVSLYNREWVCPPRGCYQHICDFNIWILLICFHGFVSFIPFCISGIYCNAFWPSVSLLTSCIRSICYNPIFVSLIVRETYVHLNSVTGQNASSFHLYIYLCGGYSMLKG